MTLKMSLNLLLEVVELCFCALAYLRHITRLNQDEFVDASRKVVAE